MTPEEQEKLEEQKRKVIQALAHIEQFWRDTAIAVHNLQLITNESPRTILATLCKIIEHGIREHQQIEAELMAPSLGRKQ